jgi:hypothetical protein
MKDVLQKRSIEAARRAIRHYVANEYDQFLIQAAHSFELLGKARLSAIHPSLIIDRDFDSLLRACAASKHTSRPPWSVKTVTATEVLKRCCQLNPALTEFKSQLSLLAEYRNSAIHLGEIVETERKEIFHAFLCSTSLLGAEIDVSATEVFGEFTELVATHLDNSLAETNREVAERIALGRGVFRKRYFALDSDQMEFVATSIKLRYPVEKYERMLFDCPACGYPGLLSGTHNVDWDVDYDDDGGPSNAFAVVTLVASSFDCAFCDLSLNGSTELNFAGLPTSVDINDVDQRDFYEQDHEYQ